jgi:hypothetical protein
MPLIDYTSRDNVKAYGNTSTVTAGADALLDDLVTALSRQLDTYCCQVFAQQTYTSQVRKAAIDRDGLLLCWPAVPTMSTPTAAQWKPGNSMTWYDLNITTDGAVEVEEQRSGCVLRFLGNNLATYRAAARIQVRLSYTGGWETLDDVPEDFEYLARRLVWWAFKKRDAPIDKTAMPQLGQLIIPSNWPADLREGFSPWKKRTP